MAPGGHPGISTGLALIGRDENLTWVGTCNRQKTIGKDAAYDAYNITLVLFFFLHLISELNQPINSRVCSDASLGLLPRLGA